MATAKRKSKSKKKEASEITETGSFVCCACDGSHYEELNELPEFVHSGVLPDGSKFTSIIRKRVRCSDCKQVGMLRINRYDSKLWRE